MTKEKFIARLTEAETRWDLTIKSDYMNGVFIATTIKSTDPDRITIQSVCSDSITIDISESEIDVIDEDFKYSVTVEGIKFIICESIY